jgi:hypothetical protein
LNWYLRRALTFKIIHYKIKIIEVKTMNPMAITIGGLATGLLLQQKRDLSTKIPSFLTKYAIWVALPAMILYQIPSLSYTGDLLVTIIMPWSIVIFGAALVLLLSKILKWSKSVTGAMLLAVPLGNTSFFGIPMITLLLGEEYAVYGIMYDQFGSFLAVATYGAVVIATYSGSEQPTLSVILKKIFTFPPFVALLTALSLGDLLTPLVESGILLIFGSTMVPAMMIAIGLKLKLTPAKGEMTPFVIGLVCRLLLFPMITLMTCVVIGCQSEVIGVAVLESGMPSMLTASVLAMSAGLAPQLVASLIGWGMLISFVTLPILSVLIKIVLMW